MMNTIFFKQIAELDFEGVLQLNIAKGADDNLIVSVLLNNEKCDDNAKNLISPFNIRGKAEELDNGFFEKITEPIQQVSGLMVDMEKFLKQLEEARRQSAMEKEKTDRQKKEQDTKEKKYKEAMAKAQELERAGKHREAWMKLPKPSEFPDYAETIRKRQTELSGKFAAPSLFGAMDQAAPELPQTELATVNSPTGLTGEDENEF